MRKQPESKQLDFSVVIPLLNEAESLRPLYEKLNQILPSLGKYELIFVDDGSTDNSFSILTELHAQDQNVKVIQLRRNFGKSDALAAGFNQAKGKIVVTLDADLQDDPSEIPALINKLKDGFDLVSGWKYERKDALPKRMASRIFNKVASVLTGIPIHDFNCGLKAYKVEVVRDIQLYGELHRYIPALAYWKGYKVGEVKVKHHPRKYGKSKFGMERYLRGFFDLFTVIFLTKYTRRPLHLFGILGLLSLVIGFVINAYLSIIWFMGQSIGHRPLLMLGVLLMVMGVQFISIGLLGEMIAVTKQDKVEKHTIKRVLE